MKDFYQPGYASVIIDGQFGSTGKGLLAGYMAKQSQMLPGHVVHTTNAAPNAGHTTQWLVNGHDDGEPPRVRKIVTYHLPTGGVMRNELCYLNAGAVIDIAMFAKERQTVEQVMGQRLHVMVHPNAVLLLPEDKESEVRSGGSMEKISSTQKGVGSAIARKVRREAHVARDYKIFDPLADIRVASLDPNRHLKNGQSWSIEVPQGISLGLNHGGFYPYCTSREVSVAQALSDANIHPRYLGRVALCMRTFPIRVGSLPGQTSGGYHHDQREVDWAELPVSGPELTTVTQRPRRIFSWSREQYRDALYKAAPSVVFLNFVNYFQNVKQFHDHMAGMQEDHDMVGLKPQIIFGFGPNIEDVIENHDEAHTHLETMLRARAHGADMAGAAE